MNIVGQATTLRDRFNSQYGGNSDLYGQQKRLFKRIRESQQIREEEISPRPTIYDDRSNENALEGISRIRVEKDQYRVLGVSRRYLESDLKSASIDYIIRETGKSDTLCVLEELTPKTLTWEMVLTAQTTEEEIRWQ